MFRSLRSMIRSLTRKRPRPARPATRMMAYRKFGLQLEHLEAREVPAAIAFNNVATYTQDFQSLVDTNLTPAAISNTTMAEISTLAGGGSVSGWYAYGTAGARWGRSDGSSNTGSFFGMRDSGTAVNLALGSQGSGSNAGFFGLVLENTSGTTINSISLTYDAVINRNPSTTVNAFPLSYRVSSTNVVTTSSTADGTFNNSAGTWTNGTGFSTPTTGTGAPGTQAAINPIFTIGNVNQTLTSLSWGAGQFLYVRFAETDEGGADATAGVDNVVVAPASTGNVATSAAVTAVTPTTAPFGDSVSFTATITAATGATPPPAGTVNFRAGPGGTIFATTSTVASTSGLTSTFTASSTSVPVGLYSNVIAEYVAGTGFDPSTSAAFGTTLTVTTTTTTTLNTITPSTLAAGVNFAFTGTVAATNGTLNPSGTVEIRDGGPTGTLLATATGIGTGGVFTARGFALPAGSYTDVRAYYIPGATGNGPAFLASNSAAQALTVDPSTPTALAAGDAVINGFYGNNATGVNERFSFVILKDVTPGTVLNFTDAAWLQAGGFGTNEGFYSLSFNAAFAAGSRFYYEATNENGFGAFYDFAGGQTGLITVTGGTDGSNSGFSNGGDNLTAFQGTLATPTSLIYAFSTPAFLTSGSTTTSNTYLPTGLAEGSTAISLNSAASNGTHTTPAATTGTASQIAGIVSTLSIWTVVAGGTGSVNTIVPPATTYTISTGGTATTTTLSSISPTTVNQGEPVTFTGTVVASTGTLTPAGTIEIREGGPTGPLLATSTAITGSGATGSFSFVSSTVPAGTYTNVTAYYLANAGFANSNSAGGASLTVNAVSPTTLVAGDVAFTGYLGTNTPERFSFVLLKDVNATTSLTFTDNAWDGAAFLTNEGTYTITFNQAFAAGSRFYYAGSGTPATSGFFNFDGTQTGISGTFDANLGLNNTNDNLTAFQGTLLAPTSFVTALTTSTFDTTGTPTLSSYLPAGLAVGTTAIELGANNATLNTATLGNTVTASAAAAISTTANTIGNWTTSGVTSSTVPPQILFVITSGTGTTSALAATPATPAANTAFDLTATVSPNPGAGIDVVFKNGATVLGTAQTDANGVATLTVAAGLPSGSYTVTSEFAGNASFGASLGVRGLNVGSAGNLYHALSGGDLTQDWTNTGLITADDNWGSVPSIRGYRGDNLTTATGVDPQTVLAPAIAPTDTPAGVLDVIANQGQAYLDNTSASGGVAEVDGIANPTIALNGTGTADAPFLVLYIDATGVTTGVRVRYNVRDLDSTADNAVQQVALQYRIGETGDFVNVPGGYIADATTGGTATQVTAVDVTLPAAVNGQSQVQIRIITTNAAGNDEAIGIDDIIVSQAPATAPPTFTSGNSVTFAELSPGTFSVTATGNPTPTITLTSGTLPTGVTFTNGVLSGTPALGTANTYNLVFTATNGVNPDATQNFTLTVTAAPPANPVSITATGTPYTQDFDSLTGTAWTNGTTLAGWSLFRQPAPGVPITAIALTDGNTTTGSFYSFGTTSASDRALGGIGSGGAYFGSPATGAVAGWQAVALLNSTGGAVNSVAVTYDGEQWRNGGNVDPQTMVLEYGYGSAFTGVATWTAAGTAFDFTSPVTGATAAALDGNLPANRVAGIGGTLDLSSTPWAAGSVLWLRWVETNEIGGDHGLAVDNFSFTANGGTGDTTPPTLVSIDDNDADDLLPVNVPQTYTVTFSEDILNGSFTAADLDNAGTATITIGTVTETSPGVFSVVVTPTTGGTVILRIPTGAVVEDVAGNDLVVPVQDDTTVTVDATVPTVAVTDNVSGGPVTVGAVITYTLSFSEPVTGLELGDFTNSGTATGTFGSLTGGPTVYTVQYTTTGAGTAILRVTNAGAVIEDAAGNDLATPATDDTTISVNAAAANGVFALSAATYTTSEGVGTFLATITRTGGSSGAVTVPFTVTPGSAAATADYVVVTTTPVSFTAGQTSATIAIAIVDDGSNEANQDFTIDLQAPSLGSLGAITNATVTITDPVLVVSSLTATNSGVVVNFNRGFDTAGLNLYDVAGGTLGAADVTVAGTAGSLVVLPGNQLYFIKTGAEMAAGTYATTVRSAADGLKDLAGVLLDGDANGTAGGDFSGSFTVAAYTDKVVRVGDFTRGRTQTVSIPLTISDGAGVTAVDAELIYDPALLDFGTGTITSPVAGWSGSFNPNFATLPNGLRVAKFNVFGSTALTGTNLVFATIPATVPATALYANKEVLRLQNTFWNESNVVRTDDAVHVAAYFGDATGNGGLSGQDASLVSQLAAGSGTGFVAFQNADPVLIADATLNGGLSGQDASLISQKAAGATIASIPDPGPANPPQGGPDPRMYFGNFTGAQGQTVTVPMRFNVAEPGGISGVQSMDLAATFDASRFSVSNVRYKPGSPWALAGWVVTANVDNATGTLRIVTFSPTAPGLTFAQDYDDESLLFDFFVKPTAAVGSSPLNVAQNVGSTNTAINEGAFTLLPAPTNGTTDANVDGTFTVTAATTSATLFWAGANAAADATFTTQLRVTNNGTSSWTATSIDSASTFDPTKLQIVSVTAGSLLTGAPTPWTVTANIDNAAGTLRVVTFASNTPGITVIPGQIGDVLNVTFQVAQTATGTTYIDLRPVVNPTTTAINEGAVTLSPAPANATNQSGVDAVITVAVNPNKPPFNAVPAATQQVLWNSAVKVGTPNTRVFSTANGNAITVSDGNGVVTVTTTVSVPAGTGTLTLGSLTGVTVTAGASGTNTVSIQGTTTAVTAALNGLSYRPADGYTGTHVLTVSTNDGGNSGFGGALTDTRTITLQVVGLYVSEVMLSLADTPAQPSATSIVSATVIAGGVTGSVELVLSSAVGLTTTAPNNRLRISGNSGNLNGVRTVTSVSPDGLTVRVSVPFPNAGTGAGTAARQTTVALEPSGSAFDTNAGEFTFITPGTTFPFLPGQLVTISGVSAGANGTNFNGTFTITSVDTASFFFTVNAGGAADGDFDGGAGGQAEGQAAATPAATGARTPNQYVEVFSTVPNYVIPAGVYLVGIEGDNATGVSAFNDPGLVQDVFSLGGFTTGPGGYLTLVQTGQQYTAVAGVAATDPNSVRFNTAGSGGFGNGGTSTYGAQTNVHTGQAGGVGTRAGASELQTEIEKGSASYLLIQAAAAPLTTDDIDADNNGVADGALWAGWNVLDGVAILDATSGTSGADASYAPVTFKPTANTATPAGTVISTGSWAATYAARIAQNKGYSTADWVASTPTGSAGNYQLSATQSTAFGNSRLNHVGELNAWAPQASVLVNDGTSSQRSQVSQLLLNFTEGVNFNTANTVFAVYDSTGAALSINMLPLNGTQGGTSWTGVTQVKITFNAGVGTYAFGAPDVYGNAFGLNDGNYFLKIFGSTVTGTATGLNLDGDGDGLAGGNSITQFHRLFGDANGDRTVDGADNAVFNTTRNRDEGQAQYLWFMDYDQVGGTGGIGRVNNTDRSQFTSRLWSYLPPSNTPPGITP